MEEQTLILVGLLRYYIKSIEYYLFLGGERMATWDYLVATRRTSSHMSGYLICEWFDLQSLADSRKFDTGMLPVKEKYETV
jgi:hypothetical protein